MNSSNVARHSLCAFIAVLPLLFAFSGFVSRAVNAASPPPAARPSIVPKAKPKQATQNAVPQAQRLRLAQFTLRPDEYIPVNQLRPGMRGVGLTVFQGTTIEKFDVKILGILKKANNGRDLIVVKLGGNKNLTRVSDIIAGMSGSPVYINNRIVGAVSMGAAFTKESIGYLTPIMDMLEAWDPALPAPARPRPLPPGIVPLRTAVNVSGVSPMRFAAVAEKLAKLGLSARQGAGGAALNPSTKTTPNLGRRASALVPGGAVGMSLATGDLDITALGTLTYRRGDRIVAFGHPFLGIGALEAPMFSAVIHDIEPSYNISSKIGSPVSLVGAFLQDRPFSVAGRIGAKPFLIPVTVRVNDRAQRRTRVFRAQIVRHQELTEQLLDIAATSAISEIHGQPGDATARVSFELVADEVGTIRRSNRVFSGFDISAAASGDLLSLVGTLGGNNLYPLGIRSVTMDVQIENGRKTAQIERVFLRQTKYEPGETVSVGVVIKPFRQPSFVKNVTLRLPPTLPSGTYPLSVVSGAGASPSGGGGLSGLAALLGGGGGGGGASYSATVRQLVKRFLERPRNDEMVARLALPTPAVNVQGEKLTNLPPTLETALRNARTSSVRNERDEIRQTYRSDYVLSGSQSVLIRVARKNEPERGAGGGSPFPIPPSPGDDPAGRIPSGPPSGSGEPGRPVIPSPSDEDEEDPEAVVLRAAQTPTQPPKPAVPPTNDSERDENDLVEPPATNNVGGDATKTPVLPKPAVVREEADAKSVTRAPGVWQQRTAQDFRAGTAKGVAISSSGEIRLARRLVRLAESDVPYFWSVCDDGKGGLFVGAGDNGRIYRLSPDGKLTPFAQTGELMVHALRRTQDGSLFAATSPNGRVYKINDRTGEATLILQTEEDGGNARYALALAVSADNKVLYVGTGGRRARIYEIALNEPNFAMEPTIIYRSDEAHITALAISPKDGALYAGTAPGGLLLRINTDEANTTKTASVVYDATESAIAGITFYQNEAIITTAPRGNLYRIGDGTSTSPRPLLDRALTGQTSIAGLTNPIVDEDGTIYAAAGATLYAVSPTDNGTGNAPVVQLFESPTDVQMLALHKTGSGPLHITTGNVASVYALEDRADGNAGTFESAVLDAKGVATFGRIRLDAALPRGAEIVLETRSGNTAEPNSTWEEWLGVNLVGDELAEHVRSRPARYLQYRVRLKGVSGETRTPVLRGVEVFYLPPNQPPILVLATPRGGEAWRGTKSVRWSASDPDRDTLTYAVDVSRDGGKTWTPAPRKRPAATPAAPKPGATPAAIPPRPTKRKPGDPTAAPVEIAKQSEMSGTLRERILRDIRARAAQVAAEDDGAETQTPGTGGASDTAKPADLPDGVSREPTYSLDTTRLLDGVYLLRVTASDAPANAQNAQKSERTSGEIRVVNRPPTLTMDSGGAMTIAVGTTVGITGYATQQIAVIRGVQYRINNGPWFSAAPVRAEPNGADNLIFDSERESWGIVLEPLPAGRHVVEIQAIDEAGNQTTKSVTAEVR